MPQLGPAAVFRTPILLLAGFLIAIAAPPAAVAQRAASFDSVRAMIHQMMAEHRIPSVAVAAARHGRVVWEEGFGFANVAQSVRATPGTMYSLASISKPITGTGLMVLVERGGVDLDRPINDYLAPVALTAAEGDARDATVRRVANHTAGLPLHYQFFYTTDPYRRPAMDEAIGRYGVLVTPPGVRFEYSNLGYGVLERVIERVSGLPFDEYMRREVFGPLGLRRTAVVVAPIAGDTVAERYDGNGAVIPWYDFDHRGASAVYSSASDLVRYAMYHLGNRVAGQRRILTPASLAELQRPTARRFSTVTYGVGWATYEGDHGQRSLGHGGGMPGVSTQMRIYPESNAAIVVLTNAGGGGATARISQAIADVLMPEQAGEAPGAPASTGPVFVPPPALVGTWTGEIRTWRENVPLQLTISPTGIRASVAGGQDVVVNRVEWRDGQLGGSFAGQLPTEDAGRKPGSLRLDLRLADGRLSGAVSALAANGYALSSYARLARQGDPEYDVVLLHGRIVDGTGAAWYAGDVGIRGGRIARITAPGGLAGARAGHRLDVRGQVIAPGFIDIQSHSRGPLLTGDGRLISKVTQGITTEILGEGWTNAPVNERTANAATISEEHRREFSRSDGFSRWLDAMERRGIAVNVGSFLGATTVRSYVKGMSQGAPTAAELDTMRAVVRRAMDDGAFGLASALIYPPAAFASTDELIAISREMAPYGGLYVSHIRSEGDHLLESLDEAIRIGHEAGVPVEIYHLKAMGRRNWDKIPLAIRKIDSARARGLDVQANMYPYIATGTAWTACLPPWASADGKLFENLRQPETRARIRAEMTAERTEWENNCALSGAEGMLIAGTSRPANQRYAGKRLSEVAEMMGKPWADALLDLLVSENQVGGGVYFMMSEENVELQMRQPWMKFGTDAPGLDPARATGLTHPRAYGSFPRILGHYVRERGAIGLEDAVRKLSSAVATRLSLMDRGVLREGLVADVVVFDPAVVADRATFEEPHQLSVGITHVFVNGVAVVRDGAVTGATPGRALRAPGARLSRQTNAR